MDRTFSLNQTQLDAIVAVAWLLIAVAVGLVVHRVLAWAFTRWAERSKSVFAAAIVRRTKRPAAYIFPLLAILAAVPNLDLPDAWKQPAVHITELLAIAAVAWTAVALVRLFGDVVVARNRLDVEDNLQARRLSTRARAGDRAQLGGPVRLALFRARSDGGVHPRQPARSDAEAAHDRRGR